MRTTTTVPASMITRRHGITVIEVLTVLAILAILAAILQPVWYEARH